MVFLILLILEYRGKKTATNRQGCPCTLSKSSAFEVYTPVLATYPRACHKFRGDCNKPSIKGWNGKDLYASGGSQGGLQTIWAAACGEGVTFARSSITWCFFISAVYFSAVAI